MKNPKPILGILIGLIAGLLWTYPDLPDHIYNYSRYTFRSFSTEKSMPNIIKGRYNDALYTRGKIHFLSMDSGMKECWNRTIKPLLQLSCPDMIAKSHIELELTFIMTSCFCESIDLPRLDCPEDREHREEGKDTYHPDAELILCAQGKCFNEWNYDGFDTIYKRMPDLCYFYEYESYYHRPEMKPVIFDIQLQHLLQDIQGQPGSNWPLLPNLRKLITSETKARKASIKQTFENEWKEFQLLLGDIKYHMWEAMDQTIDILWDYYFNFVGFLEFCHIGGRHN